MITREEKSIIARIAGRYRVKRIFIFGSSLGKKKARDIDLAVEGLRQKDFFKFYGDLLFSLPKPIDVIDLSKDSKFTRLIRQEGLPIYG
jgi:predicted nucleotidyltransferase